MPNIFRFAPSELSQDALLCYLVACASEATGALQQVGREFVRFLFRAGAKPNASSVPVIVPDGTKPSEHAGKLEIGKVYQPRTQRDKIDVSFQAEVDGKTVTFLIEDKTGSGKHGNQLERYLKVVSTDSEKEDYIKPIYLKTGYIFSDERESVENDHYSIVQAGDLLRFFEAHGTGRMDEILRQYEEHLRLIVTDRERALDRWDMGHTHVQWEFMLRMRELIPSQLPKPEKTWNGVKKDLNRGGSPWTQYWFNAPRGLFWRIDAGRPLRLRRSDGDHRRNNENIRQHRPVFLQVLKEIGGLKPGVSRTKFGGEMTVGAIEFPDSPDQMNDFLDRVARFHHRFLQRIGEQAG